MSTDRFSKLKGLVSPVGANVQPAGSPAPVVAGGYGYVPGAKHAVNPNAPTPAQRITQRDAQNLMNAEILAALRELVTSTTELTSQIGRQGAVNGVLRVGCYTFDSSGAMELNHPVTVGSVVVHNVSGLGSATVTVQLGPGAAASTPGLGQGFHIVPAGALVPVPIGQKSFVLYGVPGEKVNVQCFTGLHSYGVAL